MRDESQVFHSIGRQDFRKHFQPSRIVLAVFRGDTISGVNIITLCFDMHCSYKPPMMAFSIQEGAYSYALLEKAKECVLAIPGESMAQGVLLCGTKSGASCDKIAECGFTLSQSENTDVPGIAEAIANIEISIVAKHRTGNHLTAFGEVLRYGVNSANKQRCLLSVGPDTSGYRVLAHDGIHRIAVVDAGAE